MVFNVNLARSFLVSAFLLVVAVALAQCCSPAHGIVYAQAAPAAAGPFQVFLAWINQPMVKTVVALLGGFVLRQWAPFVNKAIPLALLVLSTLAEVLHVAFPAIPGAAVQPAAYMAAAFSTSSGWGGFLFGSVVPVIMAVGINSKFKNTFEWIQDGAKLFHK